MHAHIHILKVVTLTGGCLVTCMNWILSMQASPETKAKCQGFSSPYDGCKLSHMLTKTVTLISETSALATPVTTSLSHNIHYLCFDEDLFCVRNIVIDILITFCLCTMICTIFLIPCMQNTTLKHLDHVYMCMRLLIRSFDLSHFTPKISSVES